MIQALLVTKGHPFEREPFFRMFDAIEGVECTHVEQPAARALFDPEQARHFDVFVCYDMPGIHFRADGPEFEPPSPQFQARFLELLDAGQGCVFLHHALAGWPAWPEFAEIVGGRFLYLPGELRGRGRPDSGYRHHVTHRIRPVDFGHPIVAGVPEGFEITDELYLAEVFEESVRPLLRSDHAFTEDNFYSAARAVRDGRMYDNQGWHHEPGSDLVGWTKSYGNSPICYLQCGDDPEAWQNPHFQRLLGNAISWAASNEAHAWARAGIR